MASNILTADGTTRWMKVTSSSVHVALVGTFGGGTVTVEQEVNGTTANLLDSQAAITSTADDDYKLNVSVGDKIRLNLTGATTPSINWEINNAGFIRG